MLPVMLLLSILLALVPLAGIAWIVITRSLTSVDGLFMSLILLTLSGVFLLNVLFEMDARGRLGFLHKSKPVHPRDRRPPRLAKTAEDKWQPIKFRPRFLSKRSIHARAVGGERFSGAARARSPSHVHAQSPAVFCYRLVDRADAVLVLVEHLVWPAPLGQATQRIPQRREASAAYSACARPIGRAPDGA